MRKYDVILLGAIMLMPTVVVCLVGCSDARQPVECLQLDGPTLAPPPPPVKEYPIQIVVEPATVSADVSHKCLCGDNCLCPDPKICEHRWCQSTYAISFTAQWCAPCKRMHAQVVRPLRKKGYRVAWFDIDQHAECADILNVSVVPTTIVFRDGVEVFRVTGLTAPGTIERYLNAPPIPTD